MNKSSLARCKGPLFSIPFAPLMGISGMPCGTFLYDPISNIFHSIRLLWTIEILFFPGRHFLFAGAWCLPAKFPVRRSVKTRGMPVVSPSAVQWFAPKAARATFYVHAAWKVTRMIGLSPADVGRRNQTRTDCACNGFSVHLSLQPEASARLDQHVCFYSDAGNYLHLQSSSCRL